MMQSVDYRVTEVEAMLGHCATEEVHRDTWDGLETGELDYYTPVMNWVSRSLS